MPQAQWIFRKDFRRLWGLLAVVVPLEVLSRWLDSSPAVAQFALLTGLLQGLAQWLLVISLIYGEAVPGDHQYWVTRPIAWQDLLLAKAAFVLAFIHLPCFLTDAVTLVAHGQSVVRFLPSLLACQFVILVRSVLLPAALAAVTATLAQFVWYSLALFIGVYLMAFALVRYLSTPMEWGGVDWVRSTVVAALSGAISVGILLLQYTRRDTRVSRCVTAAVALVLLLGTWLPGWHAAFALQARIGPHGADISAIRVSFDPARDPDIAPQGAVFWGRHGTPSSFLPIRVAGIPAGTALYSNRATVTLTSSDGRRWSSAWDSLHKLGRFTNIQSSGLQEEQFLASGDECWQYINIDSAFYSALRAPVRMHLTWAFTLFSQPEATIMGGGMRPVPGGGSCRGDVPISCVWPGLAPQVNSVRVRSVATGAFTDSLLFPWLSSNAVASYGPFPSTVSFWQTISQGGWSPVPPLSEVSLRSRRAVAHFERDLDIRIDDATWRRFCP
jgi:hypothetical protein